MHHQDVVLCQDTLSFRAQARWLRVPLCSMDKAEVAPCKQSAVPEAGTWAGSGNSIVPFAQ